MGADTEFKEVVNMLYKFDIDLLKGTKEDGLIKVLDKNGKELSIFSLGTDKDGNIIFTLS